MATTKQKNGEKINIKGQLVQNQSRNKQRDSTSYITSIGNAVANGNYTNSRHHTHINSIYADSG